MDLLSMIIESRNRFTPLSLSPALWLSDTGSDPAVWEDLSGNSRNATQGTALNQPAIINNGLNGRQVRRFDGTNDFLNLGVFNSFLSGGEFSIYTVAKPTGSLGTTYRSYIGTSNDQPSLYYRDNTKFGFYYAGDRDFSTTLSQNTPYILGVKRSGSVWNGYVNGVIEPISQTYAGTWGTGSVYIGRESVVYYAQDIAEILVFPTALSDTNRQRVEAYLSSKWGIPTYDPDALNYFTRVEAVSSTINADNKNAINQFIIGCKADGNWSKIKASCILAGADTLSGALVPLVGTAPTNVGFLSGDYSTTSGLVGGTGKWLNTGRANNADPQDNCHAAVWVTETGFATSAGIIGSNVNGAVAQRLIWRPQTNCNEASGSGYTIATGLVGISRSLSGSYIRRNGGISNTLEFISTGTDASNLAVFARNTAGASSWTGRASFYSIGESINLALLDTRLAKLMNSLRPTYDVTALDYFARVEAVGSTINGNNKNAINQFIVGCKADGIWNSIKASCILAGADTLSGALVPLVGTAPTNIGFVAGDYSRTTGLLGDGTTKYLNSNRSNSADLQNSHHYSFYASTPPNIPGGFPAAMSSTLYDTTGATQIYRRQLGGDRWEGQSRNSTGQTTTALAVAGATFVGMSRSDSITVTMRANQTSGNTSVNSQLPGSETTKVFSYGTTPSYNGRIAFYSIGEYLDLALLDARVSTLMSSLT